MKNIIVLLLAILNMSCQAQIKNKEVMKKVDQKTLLKYFNKISDKAYSIKKGKLNLEGKSIAFNDDDITINNIYPHPSREFNENIYILHYVVKNDYGKISFWKGDSQISETGNAYPKIVADFIATAESLTTQRGKFNATSRLLNGNVLVFPDGLKIKLTGFTHRRTYINERSPAIAHLKLSDNSELNKFTLWRNERKDEHGKWITSYTSEKWKNYNVELTGLAYDEYIDIVVSKK